MNKNEELLLKITEFLVINEINDTNFSIKMLGLKADRCRKEIEFMSFNKPYFYERKKLKEYNSKMEELNKEILKTYREIESNLNSLNITLNSY